MIYLTKKMNSKKVVQAAKQLGQLSQERFPNQKKERLGDDVRREMIFDNSENNDAHVLQDKKEEQTFTKRRIAELEAEIRRMVLKRQQEVRERYKQKEKEDEVHHNIPSGRPKRGFGFRRIKSAQQQSQPETVGRRTTG